jgi:pimeloyl-ACP methyl ester carboxylesterase
MSLPFDGRFASRQETVNGLRIAYTEWNPAGRKAVVMVHGLHGQGHAWDPVADLIAAEYRVVCPDLRGHGESSWSREGYWTRNFVEDLHQLVQRLGLAPALYVGHSLGARIGYAYGATYPSDLRGMVLSDAGPETPKTAAQSASKVVGSASASHGFRSREEALAQLREQHPEWQPIFHELDALYQLRENWAGKFVYKHDPDLFWITRSAGLKEIPELWAAAARAKPPTLILKGERSPYLDQALLDRLLATMPKAEAAIMPTGHYIPREQPEAFARRVLDFARGL